MTKKPKYPTTRLRLNGAIPPNVLLVAALGAVLQRAGVDRAEISEILRDVVNNGSDDILAACRKYVVLE